MKIIISALEFKAIIGILDFEREVPQKVQIDCTIEYDYPKDFIDYAKVVELIVMTVQNGKFQLLEEALMEVSKQMFLSFPTIQAIDLTITKPDILPHCNVALNKKFKP